MNPSPDDPLGDPQHAKVLERLRAQTPPIPSVGFSDRVVGEIRRRQPWPRPLASIGLRAAAIAIFLLGIYVISTTKEEYIISSSPDSVLILMSAQREDGGWPAHPQHITSRYDIGVTALAILALIHAEPGDHDGSRLAAIRLGADYLVQCQRMDGRIGSEIQRPAYTHYLATQALEAAARLPDPNPSWRIAVERARSHLPPNVEMANLNRHLANPADFPERWADAGGPVAHAAIQLLKR